MWILIVVVAVVLALVALFAFGGWRLGDDGSLGAISEGWLAEHRNHTRPGRDSTD